MTAQTHKYRRHSEQCRELAERAEREEERELLREMAEHWMAVADALDRLPSRRGRTHVSA